MCKAIRDMIDDGKIEGLIEGNAEGENRMAKLTAALLQQNRMADLTKSLEDISFRSELFQKYHLV